MSPDSTLGYGSVLLFINLPKKTLWIVIFSKFESILACCIFILISLKLKIEVRKYITEFFTANLWSIYIIAFDTGWSWNIFSPHNICELNSHRAGNQPQKVRSSHLAQNWKIRLEVQYQFVPFHCHPLLYGAWGGGNKGSGYTAKYKTHFSFDTHWVAHRPQKRENWELVN